MNLSNKDYLKQLEAEWYDALLQKKDITPSDELIEKTRRNAKRNAKRTLQKILMDRISTLQGIPENEPNATDVDIYINELLSTAKSQLEELEQFITAKK